MRHLRVTAHPGESEQPMRVLAQFDNLALLECRCDSASLAGFGKPAKLHCRTGGMQLANKAAVQITADRVLGVILGTALGDSLGLPYEGLSPRRVARRLGSKELGHSLLFGRGMVSDDTEHTCLVARALVASRHPEYANDVDRFRTSLARGLRWWLLALPPGIGWGTLRGVGKLWLGVSSKRSGVRSAGNGPAMRSALLGLCARDRRHMRALVAASTRITHSDPRAEQGALVIARAARLAAQMDANGEVITVEILDQLLEDIDAGDLRAALEQSFALAGRGASASELAQAMGWAKKGVSGFVVHTVPAALFCWLRYRDDARAPIRAAIEFGGDTDTCGAIVGALVGAERGAAALPADWLRGLWDWPLSARYMKQLAAALAGTGERMPGFFWPASIARNLFAMTVILSHAVRRIWPLG